VCEGERVSGSAQRRTVCGRVSAIWALGRWWLLCDGDIDLVQLAASATISQRLARDGRTDFRRPGPEIDHRCTVAVL